MSVPASGGFPARISETCFYPVSLAVDATQAFYGCQDGTLRAVPKAGGVTRTLFRREVGGGSISGIALDASNVYFTSTSDGTVNRISKQGGDVTTLALWRRRRRSDRRRRDDRLLRHAARCGHEERRQARREVSRALAAQDGATIHSRER
jgi:hypothetical protein